MKIALIGYGKMGKMVEKAALAKGHTITSIISPSSPNKTITKHSLADADVCIEFSRPDCALENIKQLAALGKNIVVGTTGWQDHLKEIEQLVKDQHIGLLYASNFSIGMAFFLKIISQASKLISSKEIYDVAGLEIHHRQKLDKPSGSALMIAEQINQHFPLKVEFESMRLGTVPGTHTVSFDCPVDTITLTHSAKNREGFAEGAVTAAEWLTNKKGLFTLEDMLF